MTLELLDHVALGLVAALVCVLLTCHRDRRENADGRTGHLPEFGLVVWLVAGVTALSTLVLLLGRNGSQDGLFGADVRLRNLLGALAFILCWGAAFLARRRGPAR